MLCITHVVLICTFRFIYNFISPSKNGSQEKKQNMYNTFFTAHDECPDSNNSTHKIQKHVISLLQETLGLL